MKSGSVVHSIPKFTQVRPNEKLAEAQRVLQSRIRAKQMQKQRQQQQQQQQQQFLLQQQNGRKHTIVSAPPPLDVLTRSSSTKTSRKVRQIAKIVSF